MKILIIEDCLEVREIVKIYLKDHYELLESKKSTSGLELLKSEKPELLILDINLPDINGIAVCEIIRKNPSKYGNPYIIMLTADTSQESLIKSLELGADDYIKKPFDAQELLLRIKRVQLRLKGNNPYLEYKNFKINYNSKLAYYLDNELSLTKKEFQVLSLLIENKGIIISREKIIDKLWFDRDVELEAVNQCIKRLRKKLPILKELIESRRGFGFGFL